jgi:AcrR family transcriptional regulator
MEQTDDLIKQQNTIRFIEATQKLIDAEGLKNLSIRKIAEKAGFHNSTIYMYFKDVDELILLASLKFFNGYSKALAEHNQQDMTAYEAFWSVWKFFSRSAFEKPDIFYNFFFGKYGDNLTGLFNRYYDLFPNEKSIYREDIQSMYFGKNIHERCYLILKPLLTENNLRLTEENLDMINDITVGYLKYLLEQKRKSPELPSETFSQKMLSMIRFMIEK